ncbi:mitochondrial import inner membrane translocase subunit TIM14 [Terramyces sp. JEL0728]|nr:mitochondrial import inner membrane translocase subunit TIM14 [Terramyces sp. JEL0728]
MATALAGRAAIKAYAKSGIGLGAVQSGGKYLRGGFESQMSSREAIQILGLNDRATNVEIKKAHRSIMLANHPDRGGSPYLASKINEAKELLDKKK